MSDLVENPEDRFSHVEAHYDRLFFLNLMTIRVNVLEKSIFSCCSLSELTQRSYPNVPQIYDLYV